MPSRRRVLRLAAGAPAFLLGCSRTPGAPTPSASPATGAGGATEPKAAAAVTSPMREGLPTRALGKTGLEVSILGLGGSHLAGPPTRAEAARIVHEAIDSGVRFLDNAWDYGNGECETRMGEALDGSSRRDKVVLMTKVCTHGQGGAELAMRQLETSLRRLRTDRIDVWQVHAVGRGKDAPENHYVPDGVLAALDRAKKDGKVRFVGFTGHADPAAHVDMLARGYAFDTCQLPVNPFDAGAKASFERSVLPELARRGVAALGMKSMGGEGAPIEANMLTVEQAIRYALTLPIATLIVGMSTLEHLRANVALARRFTPMRPMEMDALRQRLAKHGGERRWEPYKHW